MILNNNMSTQGNCSGGHHSFRCNWRYTQNSPVNFALCCCSVAKSCLAVCNPMDWSTPGFSVLHYFLESPQTRPLNQWCYLTISSSAARFCFCLQSFPTPRTFPACWLLKSGGQSIGALTSATVLSVNSQDWFPLGLTGLILQFKGLSRVFNITVQKRQFFSTQPSLRSNSHIHTWQL